MKGHEERQTGRPGTPAPGGSSRLAARSLQKGENLMSNSTTDTKAAALAQVLALIAGTQKHFPTGQFTIGNTAYTSASLVQVLQGLADTMTALNAAQAGAKDALATEQGAVTKVGPIVQAYKRLVLAAFASATQTLADFGIPVPKARTPLTTEQKAAAAAKGKATRTARGTTSKKQKLTEQTKGAALTRWRPWHEPPRPQRFSGLREFSWHVPRALERGF
jgi:hypothetical protein